jgi:methenyltetrahydromethanopterin cyclohydrolase
MSLPGLNDRALRLTEHYLPDPTALGVSIDTIGGARVIDAGVKAIGGFKAGLALSKVSLANLATVSFVPGPLGNSIQVVTDHPIPACLASQYAGWQLQVEKWFGMGSGPMRAAYGKEPLFDDIGHRETSDNVVGVIECDKLPTQEVIEYLVGKLKLPAEKTTLWCASTGSAAGTTQVVARSVEVVMHKLHELKFDLKTIRYGYGVAPLPPLTRDNFAALGRTNDAILYGGQVALTVDTDDDVIIAIGPKTPSYSSPMFGQPFLELFKAAGDFYKMDPHLFAPAEVVFHNRRTGRSFKFGKTEPKIVQKSFGI